MRSIVLNVKPSAFHNDEHRNTILRMLTLFLPRGRRLTLCPDEWTAHVHATAALSNVVGRR